MHPRSHVLSTVFCIAQTAVLLAALGGLSDHAAAAPVEITNLRAEATVRTTRPEFRWQAAPGWTPQSLRVARSAAVDAEGMLVERARSFAVEASYGPVESTGSSEDLEDSWADYFMFEGDYWVQMLGVAGETLPSRREWSTPRKVIVAAVAWEPSVGPATEPGNRARGVSIPVELSLTTTRPSVPAAYSVRVGNRVLCRHSTYLQAASGMSSTVAQIHPCYIPLSALPKARGQNRITMHGVFGSAATTGAVLHATDHWDA